MLQFLQYKTFGSHKVPDGFVIVTAGNPPEYNRSVRDFDIVTLDRVKRIDIEEDLDAFFEYADVTGVHGSIRAYLDIHKDNFYRIKSDIDGKRFVTARGWEDLSQLIRAYEKLGIDIDENVTRQYLQEPEISRDFAMYYALYRKYEDVYNIADILEGTIPAEKDKLKKAPFDEKLSILNLLMDRLTQEFADYDRELGIQKKLQSEIKEIAGDESKSILEKLSERTSELENEVAMKAGEHLMDKESEIVLIQTSKALTELRGKLAGADAGSRDDAKKIIKEWFAKREQARREAAGVTSAHLKNAFVFLESVYGQEQELVLFLTRLDGGHYSLKFIQNEGSEEYYKFNKLLLLRDRRQDILAEILEV
jgi:hypothetical protein